MTMDSLGGAFRNYGRNGQPLVSQPTLVSGTAQQFYKDADSIALVTILGHAGGAYTLAIKDPSGNATTIANAVALISADVITVTVPIPAAWSIDVTVSGSAAIEGCTVIRW
jgi:hypothetical protein